MTCQMCIRDSEYTYPRFHPDWSKDPLDSSAIHIEKTSGRGLQSAFRIGSRLTLSLLR